MNAIKLPTCTTDIAMVTFIWVLIWIPVSLCSKGDLLKIPLMDEGQNEEENKIYIMKETDDASIDMTVSNSCNSSTKEELLTNTITNVTIEAKDIDDGWQQLIFKSITVEGKNTSVVIIQVGKVLKLISLEDAQLCLTVDMKNICQCRNISSDSTKIIGCPAITQHPEIPPYPNLYGWTIATFILGMLIFIICSYIAYSVRHILKMPTLQHNQEYPSGRQKPLVGVGSQKQSLKMSNASTKPNFSAKRDRTQSNVSHGTNLSFPNISKEDESNNLLPPLPPPLTTLPSPRDGSYLHTRSYDNLNNSTANKGESDYDDPNEIIAMMNSDASEHDYDYITLGESPHLKAQNTSTSYVSENSLYSEMKLIEAQSDKNNIALGPEEKTNHSSQEEEEVIVSEMGLLETERDEKTDTLSSEKNNYSCQEEEKTLVPKMGLLESQRNENTNTLGSEGKSDYSSQDEEVLV